MKIISWNVNGIRANQKKGGFDWLLAQDADIFCLQETKAHPEQLEDKIRNPEGYFSYFDHSKMRKGYSGVAIFSKLQAEHVEYGIGVPDLDKEGRSITLYFKKFVLINTYFPNGGGGPERLEYKLKFYKAFLQYIKEIEASGLPVIFCGDVNTAHKEIDLARPKENIKNTGFLPIERAWIDEVIKEGFVDVYRHLFPTTVDSYTYWDMKTFARERNVGWRIDYFFASSSFIPKVLSFKVFSDVTGSDHCPIEIVTK